MNLYFSIMASKNLQKSSAIQNNSVTLSSVIIAIIVCNSLYFNTIKLQQFSLITKFSSTYISSNSRYINIGRIYVRYLNSGIFQHKVLEYVKVNNDIQENDPKDDP